MNQLTELFHGQELRIVEKNNEVWFVAKDVCDILGIKNPSDALKRLDEDERARLYLGRQGSANVVNEFGLYNLVLGSRKHEAKEFKRWITHEVIPSIRKHGAYMTPETIEQALLNPDTIIQLATNLKEEQSKRKKAEQTIEQQKPLVNFAETCMTSEQSLLVREVAKLASKQGVKTGERRLWQKLREWGLIFKHKNEPYQEYVDRDYFEITQGVKETNKGAFTWVTMRVKPKGQAYIINRLKKELI